MRVDLKERPSLKEIASSTSLVGASDLVKSHFLVALQYASKAMDRYQPPGATNIYIQAALKLCNTEGMSPSRAFVMVEKAEAELKQHGMVNPRTLETLDLCKKDAVQRRREMAADMQRASYVPPQQSDFGRKVEEAAAQL